ncbi:hypothetical protein C1H46_019217 [Malus baccata]|uniref:Uncharacterized protein n=1 Tax=Malus baccata TaxID=106549 RepID=A0A540M8Q5_MALBA|nr:hypothetical protein C1H46_019217 [Malus baccata]
MFASMLMECPRQFSKLLCRLILTRPMGRKPDPFSSTGTGHSPINPNQLLKALVDRFMKEGAEDLWNEKDGPIVEPLPSVRPDGTTRSIAAPPLDLRKLISKGRDLAGKRDSVNLSNLVGNYVGSRNYSSQSRGRFRRNDSSSDDSKLIRTVSPYSRFRMRIRNLGEM